jgi:predicted Zn-dependent protease with MMP-like domain
MYEATVDEVEQFVHEAIEALPEDFKGRISNVAFTVEDRARPEDYGREVMPVGSTLLGVYRGVPLTRRGAGYNMVMPDRIVIFREPLQQLARDEDDLRDRIGRVVRHEIAHYFGISDERLREIDAY